MSGRALKRARINARDHSRLTFLLRCMSDEELIRLRLMSGDEERPSVAMMLLRLDQNEKRFRVADARLRKTKPCPVDEGDAIDPQGCKCARCGHHWIGFYLPQAAITIARIMAEIHCPRCGANHRNVRLTDTLPEGRFTVGEVIDAFRDESIFKSGDTSIDVHIADEIEMTP